MLMASQTPAKIMEFKNVRELSHRSDSILMLSFFKTFDINLNSVVRIGGQRRSKYLKIDDEKRRIIIFEVMVMNNSLKNVCLKHNINFSSAKNVVQIFKKEGRLEKKVQRARKGKRKDESKSDQIEDEDSQDEEQKSAEEPPRIAGRPQCQVLLQMQEDDSFRLIPLKRLPDQVIAEIKAIHSQIMTQSSFSTNSCSD